MNQSNTERIKSYGVTYRLTFFLNMNMDNISNGTSKPYSSWIAFNIRRSIS